MPQSTRRELGRVTVPAQLDEISRDLRELGDAFSRLPYDLTQRLTDVEFRVAQGLSLSRETIREAVIDAMPSALLTDDQHRWVELAIQKEAQTIAFRRAVIEKTTLGLVWAALVAIGLIVKEYLASRGLKL